MHQTLLALGALCAAGVLTISQVETQHSTVESVVRDQFELAVAGTLLHTMEFVDSRAFDAATTPARLRARYGLPATMSPAERDTISFDDLLDVRPSEFSAAGEFGGVTCNVADPAATALSCNDVDDVHGAAWQLVDLRTPDGHSIPVEVRVEVAYVESAEGDAIDRPVPFRTNHKRVEVFARTEAIRSRGGAVQPLEVTLRRVLSFDTKVAAEYLRRSIGIAGAGETCEAEVGPWNERMAALRAVLAGAIAAQAPAAAAVAAAEQVRSDAAAAEQQARQGRDAAAAAVQARRNDVDAAEDAIDDYKRWARNRWGYYYFLYQAYWAGLETREAALGTARAAHAATQTLLAEAEARLDAVGDVTAAAEAGLEQARRDAQGAADDVTDAQREVDDHESTRPECSA